MTIQDVYKNYVEKTSKDFLEAQPGDRARRIEERNSRFYGRVNEKMNPSTTKDEVLVLEV